MSGDRVTLTTSLGNIFILVSGTVGIPITQPRHGDTAEVGGTHKLVSFTGAIVI